MSAATIEDAVSRLREACVRYDMEALTTLLRSAVPEFEPAEVKPSPADTTVVAFPTRNARKV